MMADEHLGHFPCLGTHKLNSTKKLCQHHFANGSIDQVQDYDWPSTGGVLIITAAVWTAGFHWWRSGNKKRTQNVSEYMLVLALCLVFLQYLMLEPWDTWKSASEVAVHWTV